MPLHFPLARNHQRRKSEDHPPYISPSPARTITASSTASSAPSDSAPSGILQNGKPQSSASGSSSQSGSSRHITKRMSGLSTFDRTDTISSTQDSDDERDGTRRASSSTPATSVSSLNNQCPLPQSSASGKFPFVMMTLSSSSTLSFIALPLAMRPVVLEAVNKAWKRGVSKTGQVEYQRELMERHRDKGCEGGVWEVNLKDTCWMPSSQDKVSSKRILIDIMTAFAREGYSLSSSFRTSAKDSGKDTLIFRLGEPDPEPVFFAVAFYSHDRIWIIDAEAEVGEALEEGIKTWWVDGVQGVRTRERHCREIRLKGNPWTAHSTSSLISARCIHLMIMKTITHCSRRYDYVGSVDMADREEGEMPVTFYRKKWGGSTAV